MIKDDVSRREFIKRGAIGIGAATVASGLRVRNAKAFGLPAKWEKEADVIVIGFGAGGAAAAIEAHDAGATVLILEKEPIAGGSAALSGGIVYGARTSVQKAAGITDSADEMYKYWMAVNKDLLDSELLRSLSENCSSMVEWLIHKGVEFRPDQLTFTGREEQYAGLTPPVKRGHCPKGRGSGMMAALIRAVTERKIEVLFETKGSRFILNQMGEVVGVKAKSGGGDSNIKAKRGVVLTTGGYARNRELIKSYFPALLGSVPWCGLGLTGDGLLMAEKIGAPIVNTGVIELPPILPALEVIPGQKALVPSFTYFLYKKPVIFINEKGERFCDETANYQSIGPAIVQQKASFMIFDDKVKKWHEANRGMGYGFSSDLSTEIKKGVLKKASTIGELAKLFNIDSSIIEETFEHFNRNVSRGIDPEFGRHRAVGALETPPFYGGKMTTCVVETLGGLAFNKRAQVLDAYGEPIPRLYAAGAVTATVRAYPGSGAFLTFAFVFGRIAGKQVATEIPSE